MLYAIKTSPNATTGIEPYTLLYGYKARIPSIEDIIPRSLTQQTPKSNELRKHVINTIEKYPKAYQAMFNEQRRTLPFVKDDLVYVLRMFIGIDDSKKLSTKYGGPFRVKRTMGQNLVKFNITGGRSYPIVHVQRLRRAFVDRNSPSESEHDSIAEAAWKNTEDADPNLGRISAPPSSSS